MTKRLLDGSLHFLDRTALDRDGLPVGVVDDVDIDLEENARPVITDLVLTSGIVAPLYRGHPPDHRVHRLPWSAVLDLDAAAVDLDVAREEIETTRAERWVRDRIIARIPGGRHAPE